MDGDYKDKKAGLIVVGIFEILGGLFCALIFSISVISLLFVHDAASIRQLLMGVSVYAFFAVWLISMGIGTVRARRGARLLMLASSWIMLVCGILAMGMMFLIMPKSVEASEVPTDMMMPILIGIYIVLAVIYLVFPTIGILFYGNRNVRATIESADPGPSWTEQCPLPVLVLVLMLAMATVSILMRWMNSNRWSAR